MYIVAWKLLHVIQNSCLQLLYRLTTNSLEIDLLLRPVSGIVPDDTSIVLKPA
jgi:hypothetical protein